MAKKIFTGFVYKSNKEIFMTEINFKSTFRIPVTQPGMNAAKKKSLKNMASEYKNSLAGNGNTGFVRVSIPENEDTNFVQQLKTIGCKIYQVFEKHNINKNEIDEYIKDALKNREFKQVGKQMKKASKKETGQSFLETKVNNKVDENLSEETVELTTELPKKNVSPRTKEGTRELIRQTPDYIRLKNQYGEEFVEAMYFGR